MQVRKHRDNRDILFRLNRVNLWGLGISRNIKHHSGGYYVQPNHSCVLSITRIASSIFLLLAPPRFQVIGCIPQDMHH